MCYAVCNHGAILWMFMDPGLAPGIVPGGLHTGSGDLHADGAYILTPTSITESPKNARLESSSARIQQTLASKTNLIEDHLQRPQRRIGALSIGPLNICYAFMSRFKRTLTMHQR